jgi:hypothetical protein
MMNELNIVELIESNPITKLTTTYNNKLLNKIKENFTEFEQQAFVSSIYCYLNYDNIIDFIIDLDNIWEWLGFYQKLKARVLLEKNFVIDKDYKVLLTPQGEQKKGRGGHNKTKIMMTIKTFKSFCLKAGTKKADEIHGYYIKLEELIQEICNQETNELKLQLQQKETTILEKENTISEIKQTTILEKEKLKKDKHKAVEKAIITQFPVNTECIYFGTIDNTNDKNEKLIKFGHTNDLTTRVWDHHSKYDNFILQEVFKVQNKVEIENLIKTYPKIKRQIRTIEVKGKNKTEIIAYDDTNFTITRLTKHIKDIIHSKTYSIDNFNRIMKLNDDFENENRELKEHIVSLNDTINKQGVKINELTELVEKQKKSIDLLNEEQTEQTEQTEQIESECPLLKRFDEFIKTECIVRKDVEVDSCDIIAQFRIWNKVKPKRETNERFNTYLKTRFMAARLQNQDKHQCVHGFVGLMLKSIEYQKTHTNDPTETFIFENCRFSANNRIASKKLQEEFLRYKNKMALDITSTELSDIKNYLDDCPYVLKGTLYIQEEKFTHEGYYGLALKTDNPNIRKTTSVTGKKVQKIDVKTESVINNWDTIAKAALYEKISASKMSRCIKNKIMFEEYYYK